MTAMVNPGFDPGAVQAPSAAAWSFHRALASYAPTPATELPRLADELGLGSVIAKDETLRLGLPAFKALGASWAIERALAGHSEVHRLVAASAGNHGRAVAHVAAARGLAARIFVPERSLEVRRRAIAAEGAELVVITGSYEDAVAAAGRAATEPGAIEISDVGDSAPAHDVIDGYGTLFTELDAQAELDLLLVPIGVGSLGAAAARYGTSAGVRVVGVEPAAAACLTASLGARSPVTIPTPGTAMAGMDCAEVSDAAWPSLRDGIAGTVLVDDEELESGIGALADAGIDAGECSGSTVAALRTLAGDADAQALRDAIGCGPGTRVALVATEGPTGRDEAARHVS